ncbi:MAG: right-handed parallel beta-helix repeat-containing protein [Deltaproteobacteria bacterium]|nr:right-handed parallel beta-helix repeat-containing protein [Deltaproteobacteria bacterium]
MSDPHRMSSKSSLLFAALIPLAACSSDPCEGVSGACIAVNEGATTEEIQTALLDVPEGGTVAFAAGTFQIDVDLSLDVDGVTVKGAGADATTLSFANQKRGPQGLLVTSNNITVRDIGFEDSPGDALKLLGSVGVTIQRTRVEWTRGPNSGNGAYGLYPVQCKDVIIEDSKVIGASDAGIYVGQSENVVVRRNRAELNVAGIEIENTTHADVHDNVATKNTGGVLVFNLPDLQVKNGAATRVFDNQIFDNNTENFAPSGNIVGMVPTGTGIALLAAHGVEVFNNTISDHKSINVGMISYIPIGTFTDVTYDAYPTAIYIHDNVLSGTSDAPTGPLGALMISALGELYPNGPYIVPDIAWDGALDPVRAPAGEYPPEDRICIKNNGDADFINLAWPLNDATKPAITLTPHDCTHPPLPGVSL